MQTRVAKSVCPWWDGPCLFEALDAIEVPIRDPKGPFRYTKLMPLYLLYHLGVCMHLSLHRQFETLKQFS